MKQQTIIVVLFFIGAETHAIAQPVLSIQSFEYIRSTSSPQGKYWLDVAEAGWIKDSIRKSFSDAIYRRWNIIMPETKMSLKPPGFFTGEPKFNTKLKDKEPNHWYMFLQIFNQPMGTSSDYGKLAATLRLRCRVINGDNDSLVLDRDITVDILTEPEPAGEVVLEKLPAYPSEFVRAFDSVATWLFSPYTENFNSLRLKPACVLSQLALNEQPLAQLEFTNDDTSIHMVTQPLFSFRTQEPRYKKLTKKKNFGGNTASGIITLFTGVGMDKSKTNDYSADFSFTTDTDILHCIINYREMKIAERERTKEREPDGSHSYSLASSEYSVAERRTDSGYLNVITLGADTVTSFTITYTSPDDHSGYTSLWDGADSSTIMPLPKGWNNNSATANLLIKGTIDGTAFTMQSLRERRIKNFFVNDRIVLSVYGNPLPVRALQFQQLLPRQLQIFTILSSLPYSYFNYAAY